MRNRTYNRSVATKRYDGSKTVESKIESHDNMSHFENKITAYNSWISTGDPVGSPSFMSPGLLKLFIT